MPDVVVWCIDVREMPRDLESVARGVAPMFSCALRSRKPQAGIRLEVASGLLMARVLNVVDDSQLTYGALGKPRLSDSGAAFNLSHGGDVAALAVAQPGTGLDELGVDVERVGEYVAGAARRVLTAEQVAWIEEDPQQTPRRFAQAWTQLEAILKAEGCGFARDPRSEGVPPGWHVTSVEQRGHMLSCAARRVPALEVRWLDV